MSAKHLQRPRSVIGAAVFGTASGFESHGVGRLRTIDDQFDTRLDMRRELDLGRFMEVGLPAVFAIPALSGGVAVIVVGEIIPVLDDYARPGLAGAAVALAAPRDGAVDLLNVRRSCALAHELVVWLRRNAVDKDRRLSFKAWKWPGFAKGIAHGPTLAVNSSMLLSVHTFAPEWSELVRDPGALLYFYIKQKRNDVGEGFLVVPSESHTSPDHLSAEGISDWSQAAIRSLESQLAQVAAERDEAAAAARMISQSVDRRVQQAQSEMRSEMNALRAACEKARAMESEASAKLDRVLRRRHALNQRVEMAIGALSRLVKAYEHINHTGRRSRSVEAAVRLIEEHQRDVRLRRQKSRSGASNPEPRTASGSVAEQPRAAQPVSRSSETLQQRPPVAHDAPAGDAAAAPRPARQEQPSFESHAAPPSQPERGGDAYDEDDFRYAADDERGPSLGVVEITAIGGLLAFLFLIAVFVLVPGTGVMGERRDAAAASGFDRLGAYANQLIRSPSVFDGRAGEPRAADPRVGPAARGDEDDCAVLGASRCLRQVQRAIQALDGPPVVETAGTVRARIEDYERAVGLLADAVEAFDDLGDVRDADRGQLFRHASALSYEGDAFRQIDDTLDELVSVGDLSNTERRRLERALRDAADRLEDVRDEIDDL